ncbi:O-antigen ligase [Geothrix sp. 21YS21S-4]|uniref:O-antigen ligase family protein n=1 Tax=Geothrix sp. 21YS21S-4 TaxID=3068889 RepID=UPI0027BA6F76|nr:O-antigen ligase family protein [Geothrix sp. 21YS21S-4]
MNSLNAALESPATLEASAPSLWLPFLLGMGVNAVALAVGDPYRMAALGLAVGLAGTFLWLNKPFSWVVFVAILAANPANTTTSIALNLYAAGVFGLLARSEAWRGLPRLAQMAFFIVMLSMVVSVVASLWADLSIPSIHTTDVSRPRPYLITWSGGASMEIMSSQFVSITNYLLGPFLLIPLIFSRLRRSQDPDLLLKGLIYGLILPTLLMFLAARFLGRPIFDANALRENLVNVSTFRLGKIDIQMIRTQSGIILAALICASFAVAISPVQRMTRLMATACLLVAAYFLLVTGSVGSTLAGLAGLGLILFLGKRHFSIKRYLLLLFIGAGLALATWTILPEGVQRYAVNRYELRVGHSGSSTGDRAWRWKKSFNYLMENPSGVGWALYVEPLGIYPHNDYLTYAIAFGVVCGLVYLFYPSGLLLSFITFRPPGGDPARFALALAGAGVTTVMLINSLGDHMTANRWYFNVIWSLIWYAFFASRAGTEPADARIH